MNRLKTLLLAILLGALAGIVAVDLSAPGFLMWYNMPGGGEALCNCAEVVRATSASLLRAQGFGASIGAVLFFMGALALPRRQPAGQPGAAPPATPGPRI